MLRQTAFWAAVIAGLATVAAAVLPPLLQRGDPQPPPQYEDKVFAIRVVDSRSNSRVALAEVTLSAGGIPYNKRTGNDGTAGFVLPPEKFGQLSHLRVDKEGYEPFEQDIRLALEERVVPLKPLP